MISAIDQKFSQPDATGALQMFNSSLKVRHKNGASHTWGLASVEMYCVRARFEYARTLAATQFEARDNRPNLFEAGSTVITNDYLSRRRCIDGNHHCDRSADLTEASFRQNLQVEAKSV